MERDEMENGDATVTPSSIRLKRAYDPAEASDGVRVLVDRLWARGISKEAARLAAWMKELGPSTELRKWFGHRPERWGEFAEKYRVELATPLRRLLLAELQGVARGRTLTLIYGARDTKENEAVVLRGYLLADTIHPDGLFNAPTTVLITASVAEAARHDGIAPASVVELFGSRILSDREVNVALQALLARDDVRKAQNGWQLTLKGQQEMKRLTS
ncbi:MAG: DUF488 domain-containing protein [Chloroflexota bacterium]